MTPIFAPLSTHVSGRRFFAQFIDGIVIALAGVALSIPFVLVFGARAFDIVWYVSLVLGQVGLFVFWQARHGSTPGKAVLSIRVVTADGGVPSRMAMLKRWLPLLVEWLGIVALVGMLSSDYRQRFGDRWASTYVVEE